MREDERKATRQEFSAVVNMSPSDLDRWLATEESRKVGATPEGQRESTGHESGRRIVAIKRKTVDELDEGDYAHMREVVGYCRRHLAQRPEGDVSATRWRYSLMNWGHDPLRD